MNRIEMTGLLCLATTLASGAGVAGSPYECAAQTRSQPDAMSLSAAIEEARQSPFHALSVSGLPRKARLGGSGIDAMPFHPLQSATEDTVVTRPVVLFTFLAAATSHVAAIFLFFYCAEDDSYKRSLFGCIVGPVIPWPVVAAPAASAGVGAGKAFKASGIGLVGGAAAFALTKLASDRISHYGAGIASTLVHALITRAMLR